MHFPSYQAGSFHRMGEWLPSYALGLLWSLALCLLFMGIGLSLCGPIYGISLSRAATDPHTPLYVRTNEAYHLKVVTRVMLSGLILFSLGVGSFLLHHYLSPRGRRHTSH